MCRVFVGLGRCSSVKYCNALFWDNNIERWKTVASWCALRFIIFIFTFLSWERKIGDPSKKMWSWFCCSSDFLFFSEFQWESQKETKTEMVLVFFFFFSFSVFFLCLSILMALNLGDCYAILIFLPSHQPLQKEYRSSKIF